MLEQKAQLFSEDQVRGFFLVIGALVLSNVSAIIGAAVQYFRKIRKMKNDQNFAFNKIRLLEAKVKKLERFCNITTENGDEK